MKPREDVWCIADLWQGRLLEVLKQRYKNKADLDDREAHVWVFCHKEDLDKN